jgi:hypothetical protein
MALIVITLQDNEDEVDIKSFFEPALPTGHMEDATMAQAVAARMVETAMQLGGEVTGAE